MIAADNLAARMLFERISATLPERSPITLVTNLFEAMNRFVLNTSAISFQFRLRAHALAAADGLVAVPIADMPARDAQLYLARRTGRQLPPAVAAVAERIEAIMTGKGAR